MDFLDSGKKSAQDNMELDRALLEACEEESEALLHLYDWETDAATYGHFIDPYQLLKRERVEALSLQLAKRPTGGGIIFHTSDLAFSVLVPSQSPLYSQNTLENYAFVNRKVIEAIRQFLQIKGELLQIEPALPSSQARHFCMAKATKYDVMVEGKKVGGAAQRRTQAGFLHQGSICLRPLEEKFRDIFLEEGIFEQMHQQSYPLLGYSPSEQEFFEARAALKEILIKVFAVDDL